MNNLMPEQRPDKNGKIVTRHVKVDVSGHSINLPLPAPVVPPAPVESEMESLRWDLTSAIMEATVRYEDWGRGDEDDFDINDGEGIRSDGIFFHLDGYPDYLIKSLDELRREDPNGKFHTIASMIADQGEDEKFIDNFIEFGELDDDDDSGLNVALVRSLDHYLPLASHGRYLGHATHIRDADPEVQEGVRALLSVARHLAEVSHSEDFDEKEFKLIPHNYDFHAAPVITNLDLVDFIMDNPKKATEIGNAISKRRVFDPEAIRGIMEHPEQALADGVL